MANDFALQTDRLILRRWRETDLAPFAALNSDPRVMEFFSKLLSREESDILAARITTHIDDRGFGLWAVEAPDVAPFIGFVGVTTPSFQTPFSSCIEVGWRIAYEYWGCGYATEAASAALDDAFGRLDLPEILAFTVPANRRSRRVMEKLGMTSSPTDDFDHPSIPEQHPLRRHMLYRLPRAAWQLAS